MFKYLLCLVLICGTANAITPSQLLRDADQNEDSATLRPKYIKALGSALKDNRLTQNMAAQIQGSLNRLKLVGNTLDLYGEDLSGNDLCLCNEEYQRKIVIVDFWASYCGPCRSEIAKIKPIVAKYRNDVKVLGVNLDTNPADGVRAKIQLGIPWKNLKRTKEIEKIVTKYDIAAIPRLIIVGQDGKVKVLDAHSGGLEAEIRKLLGR